MTHATMAAVCYGTNYPVYIKEAGTNTGDAEWISVVTASS